MAIFLYGIKLSRVGVQLVSNRLKDLIYDHQIITALITGMVTTLIFSSTATTVMLVGLHLVSRSSSHGGDSGCGYQDHLSLSSFQRDFEYALLACGQHHFERRI
jgi:hypothetical protein